MSKILELAGFALIGGTIYAWIGMAIDDPMRMPIFWSCAGGALAIILYRRFIKKRTSSST